MLKNTKNDQAVRLQYGALPYRLTRTGELQVLLITSRTTRRWIIPKGWPMKGMKPADTAARKAYEEAGIRGTVTRKTLGTFLYEKDLDDGRTVPCEVKVFALKVARQLKVWPEQHEREARWLCPHEAVAMIAEEDLRTMIDSFGSTHGRPESVPKG